MAILRYGPWAQLLTGTEPKYNNNDPPAYPLPSDILPTGAPVNCADVDWAGGDPWRSLSTTWNDYDPEYFVEYPKYNSIPINTQISSTAQVTIASCTLAFHYQSTADFSMTMDWSVYAQLGSAYWSWEVIYIDENGDKAISTASDILASSPPFSLLNTSGSESFNVPQSTIGTVICTVNNGGSDYPGDSCTLKIYSTPTP